MYNEMMCFRTIFKFDETTTAIKILEHIIIHNLTCSFSNLSNAIRIFLTLPVTVASGERSFSKLKIIKNYLRSTMTQERLSDLALISIEHDICKAIDYSTVIDVFAAKKARKVAI